MLFLQVLGGGGGVRCPNWANIAVFIAIRSHWRLDQVKAYRKDLLLINSMYMYSLHVVFS